MGAPFGMESLECLEVGGVRVAGSRGPSEVGGGASSPRIFISHLSRQRMTVAVTPHRVWEESGGQASNTDARVQTRRGEALRRWG